MSEQHADETRRQDADEKTGPEGTIPASKEGVGAGASSEPNTFEPEEEPEATDDAAE
jgi:hypothetical protein